MKNTESTYKQLLKPSAALIDDIARLKGDLMILGVGGKMGPGLAIAAKQAAEQAGIKKRVIGVARFTEPGLAESLNRQGVETISADLLDRVQLQSLPEIKNVIYLAGTKFGTQGNEPYTWAMNVHLPGLVAEKFRQSRIVVFSTGNVYPLLPVVQGGASEHQSPGPVGEYAQSCLGRERIFQYFSQVHQTPVLIFRLNYANDVRYGVLMEIAKSVKTNKPIDLNMGNVNVIWQGDANEMAIRSLHHCTKPAKLLNVTGPETASVRWIAEEFGRRWNQVPQFTGEEQATALLNNAAEAFRLFGYPRVSLKMMMELVADWMDEGGKTINKETHFQERKGNF